MMHHTSTRLPHHHLCVHQQQAPSATLRPLSHCSNIDCTQLSDSVFLQTCKVTSDCKLIVASVPRPLISFPTPCDNASMSTVCPHHQHCTSPVHATSTIHSTSPTHVSGPVLPQQCPCPLFMSLALSITPSLSRSPAPLLFNHCHTSTITSHVPALSCPCLSSSTPVLTHPCPCLSLSMPVVSGGV